MTKASHAAWGTLFVVLGSGLGCRDRSFAPAPPALSPEPAPRAAPPALPEAKATERPGTAKTRLVLHAARALAPKTGLVTQPAFVVVEGDRIVRVSSEAPPGETAIVELGDATVLPGLIDAHTHLLSVQSADDASIVTEVATMTDADRALRGVSLAKQMLQAGFTTVRDLGNSGRGADVSLKRAIARGIIDGPTMIVSTRALAPPGGQFPRLNPASQGLIDQEYAVVRSPDESRAAVTQAFYEGADCIKVIVDHGPGRSLDEETMRAIVTTAHRSDRKVAAHVLTEKSAAVAVAAGVDSVEHGYRISDATLAEMAKKKIALVPTDYPLDFYARFAPQGPLRQSALDSLKKLREGSIDRLRRARKAKVTIVAGSDGYVETELADRGKEALLIFRAYAESGMSPLESVQAATINAAALLGLPANAATLEPGSVADLLVVRGDLLADIGALERPVAVVKAGRVVRRETP